MIARDAFHIWLELLVMALLTSSPPFKERGIFFREIQSSRYFLRLRCDFLRAKNATFTRLSLNRARRQLGADFRETRNFKSNDVEERVLGECRDISAYFELSILDWLILEVKKKKFSSFVIFMHRYIIWKFSFSFLGIKQFF